MGELLAVAQEYAVDEASFKAELATAWTKLMTADRFDGPTGNVCDEINAKLSAAPVCEEELSHLYKDIPKLERCGCDRRRCRGRAHWRSTLHRRSRHVLQEEGRGSRLWQGARRGRCRHAGGGHQLETVDALPSR